MAMIGQVDYRVNYSVTHVHTHSQGCKLVNCERQYGFGDCVKMKRSTRSSEGPEMNTDRRIPVFCSLSGSVFSGRFDVVRPLDGSWRAAAVYCFGPTKES